jgi:5-formyltetrahydrofolate cyclo-ligase
MNPEPLDAAAGALLDDLRRQARAGRRALSADEQAEAAARVCAAVLASPWWGSARSVAGYVATDGELDPGPVLAAARAAGKTVVLPSMEAEEMVFRVDVGERVTDRMGLQGPPPGAPQVAPPQVDLVLVPLVVADVRGGRAGRGKGYYDRAFAFRRTLAPPPRLVGLAHACQLVEAVPMRGHDVRLDAVAVGDREALVVPDLPPMPPSEG